MGKGIMRPEKRRGLGIKSPSLIDRPFGGEGLSSTLKKGEELEVRFFMGNCEWEITSNKLRKKIILIPGIIGSETCVSASLPGAKEAE